MMTRFRAWLGALAGLTVTALLCTSLPVPLQAQATINSTTLAAALGADTTSGTATVSLTSASTVVVGQVLFVNRELMLITGTTPTSTIFTVIRGYGGTARAPHASGSVVYTGPPQYFRQSSGQANGEPSGPCVASSEIALPAIFVQSGNMYQCAGGTWAVMRRGGIRDTNVARLGNGGTAYTVAGAITNEPGVVYLNGTTLAMTMSNPSTEQNGMILCVYATNASAHTVTYTAGFGGGTTARDVATFGGAVNDGFCAVANAGVWWMLFTRNVTLA